MTGPTCACWAGSTHDHLEAVTRGMSVAFGSTQDPTLQPNLAQPATSAATATRAFLSTIQADAGANALDGAKLASDTASQVIDIQFALQSQATDALDRLLQARVDDYLGPVHGVEALAGIALAIVLYLFAGFYASATDTARGGIDGASGDGHRGVITGRGGGCAQRDRGDANHQRCRGRQHIGDGAHGRQSSQVLGAVQGIAAIAEEQSAATEQVSASAEEMSAQVEAMHAQAQSLAATAQELQNLVARFKLEDRTPQAPSSEVRRSLRAAA